MPVHHKTFNKGEYCYALLSSYTNPNILIPIKALIKETKWDPVDPKYLIKILLFYDNIEFLKKYFFNMHFQSKFDVKPRDFKLKYDKKFKKSIDIIHAISGEDESTYYVVINSLSAVKFTGELKTLFNKLQNYLINKNLKELREFSTRPFYSGMFKNQSGLDFDSRLYKFIGDQIENNNIDFNYFKKGLY